MDDFDDIPVIEDDSDDLETLDFSDEDLAEFSDDQDNPLDTGAEFSGQETTEVDGEEIILEIPDAEVNLDIFSSMSDDPDLQDVDELDETSTAIAETIEEYDNTAVIPTIGAVTAGERVMVVLKNGVPTAMGSTGFGDDINLRVHEIEADYIKTEVLEAERVRVNNLLANKADVSSLTAEQIRVDNLLAGKASVSDLSAATGRIDDLEADHVSTADLEAVNGKITNLETNALTANSAVIRDIQAETAKVENLTAESLSAATGYIAALKSASIEASDISADHATIAAIDSDYIKTSDLEAERATIDNLLADKADISDLTAATGRIDDLEADHVSTDDLEAEQIRVDNLLAAKASVSDFTAEQARVNNLLADKADISTLEAEYAHVTNGTIDNAKINHADVNGLNAEVANIADARISQATITQAQVQNLSADYAKITNGKIDSALINTAAIVDERVFKVTGNKATIEEINADTITVRNLHTANLVVDSAEGYVTIGNKRTPTKEALDSLIGTLQNEIDGAVETFTSSAVPLLSNYPASDWQISGATAEEQRKAYAKHVGDICYVQNTASAQNGYAYRFAYDSTAQTFKWVLIKDSDVTKALGDISDLQTFESETNTWIEETDEGLRTIRSNHTTLSGIVDKTLVSSTQLWFSKANTTAPNKPTAQVTSTSTAGNAWRTVVPAYNASYPNYFYCYQWKYANDTFGWSAVTLDIAMGESQAQGRKGVSDAAAASNKATTAQNTANANIKSSVQLWFTKANNTAPTKPSSVISTNDAATGNAWNLAVPTYNDSYPHYFYCYQQQKGDGTYQWTDVVYDRATTENQAVARAALPSSTFETFRTTTFKEIVDTVDEQSTSITTLTEKTSSLANPNLTPWFSAQTSIYWNTPFSVDYDYATGHGHANSTEGSKDVTYLNDGWIHVILDSRASAGNENKSCYINTWVNRNQLADIIPGGTYTWLIEVRNLNITKDTLRVRPSIGNDTLDIFSAVPVNTTDSGCAFSENGAKWIQVTAKSDLSNVTRGTRGYIYVITDVYVEADVRVSLYEGEYSGPYKPYVERLENITEISSTVNTVRQTADTNTASITNLTKTVSDNKTSIEQRASTIEQNLSGITTRVSSTETNIAKETRQRKGTYAECTTDATTVNKAATISPAVTDFELYPGVTVTVCFTKGNNVASPKLNVNSTGLYPIVVTGSAAPALAAVKWSTYVTAMFTFDTRNQWRLVSVDEDVRRLSNAETKIEQNSEAITLRATKTELGQANLSPFFQSTPLGISSSNAYWVSTFTADAFTELEDGWAHFHRDNTSGTSVSSNYARMVKSPSVVDGGEYTCLVEIRNIVTNTATSHAIYTQQSSEAQFWGSTQHGGWQIANTSLEEKAFYLPVKALGVSAHSTSGKHLMYINWQVPAGAEIECDIRISLYAGKYEGPYKPYTGSQLYASQAQLKVANDEIDLRVEKSGVIAAINASTEADGGSAVKISADKVAINGTAVFSAIEDQLNNTYDTKGAAATVQENLDNLQVGGRNYILASASLSVSGLGSASGSRKEYLLVNVGKSYMDIPNGTQVTISFDLYMTVNTANPSLLVYNTNNKGPKAFSSVLHTIGISTLNFTAAVGTTINERVSITGYILDRNDATLADNYLEFYSTYGTSNWFSVKNLKLELGNKASDWSPAPEDQTAYVDSISIGGRNLLRCSRATSDNLSKIISGGAAVTSFVTEDGYPCYKVTGVSTAGFFYGNIKASTEFAVVLDADTTYTYSAWIKVTTTASGVSSVEHTFNSLGHHHVFNANSTASDKTHEDVVSKRAYTPETVNIGEWTYITEQFTTNALSGSLFGKYVKHALGDAYTVFVRDMKLERGNKATDWSPAPEDVDADISSAESSAKEYSDKLDSITTYAAGYKKFKNPAYLNLSGTVKGALVIVTSILPNHMVSLCINGYNYTGGNETINIEVSFYNYTTNFHQFGYVNYGSRTVTPVKLAKVSSTDKRAVVIIGTENSTWDYPKISVSEAMVSYGDNVPDSYADGWSMSIEGTYPSDYIELTEISGSNFKSEIASATNTANAAAPKADAIARSQRIYWRATAANGKPPINTTWLAASGTGYGNWSLNIPQLKNGNTKYPFLYTAVQTQTVAQQAAGTQCSCSPVLIDETSTIIDGASIITGSVTANTIASNAITADKIAAGAITAAKMNIGDTMNYSALDTNTAQFYGFTYDDTIDGRWFTMTNLVRDTAISPYYDCKGGEKFRVTYEISSSVKGRGTSTSTTDEYLLARVGFICLKDTGGGFSWPFATSITSSAEAPVTKVDSVVVLNPETRQFCVFIQLNGFTNQAPMSGTLKIRNLKVYKMTAGELIVDGSITAGKLDADSVKANIVQTTNLDASKITSGSMDADRIKANVISAVNNGTGTINADKINVSAIKIGDLSGSLGGRNLLLQTGSIFPKSGTSSGYFIEFTVNNGLLKNSYELEEGVEYTFSADVTSSRSDFQFSVGCGTGGFSKDIVAKYGNSSGRVSVTFTPTAAQLASGKIFAFRAPRYSSQGTSFTYSVDNVKLEKGGKATDWTPAPEDQTAYVDNSIDGIHVGGRNLLLGTGDWSNVNKSGTGTYTIDGTKGGCPVLKIVTASTATVDTQFANRFTSDIEPDTYYTLSFWAKASSQVSCWAFWYNPNAIDSTVNQDGVTSTRADGCIQNTIGTSWKRYSITWHTQASATSFPQYVIPIRIQNAVTVWIAGCMFEKGNKPTDWSPAPEDISQMVKINTAVRNFTTAQWKSFGAVGHVENWTTGSLYNNSHIRVGDTAYLTGTVTDGVKGTATIIGTVTAVNGTTSVTMSSTQLIFGGDSVDSASKTATTYIADIAGGVKIHPSGDENTGVWITDDVDIVRDGVSVAMFGTDENNQPIARIGREDKAHTEQTDDTFYVCYPDPSDNTNDYRPIYLKNTTHILKPTASDDDPFKYRSTSELKLGSNDANGFISMLPTLIRTRSTEYGQSRFVIMASSDDHYDNPSIELHASGYLDPDKVYSYDGYIKLYVPYENNGSNNGYLFLESNARVINFLNATINAAYINPTNPLEATAIPNLDASKITGGTLNAARIPNLDASKITGGTFDAARVPSLDASKINAGTFDAARIPSLNASKITAGTFNAARIPNLNASKINAGTFDSARLPTISINKGGTGDTGVETVTAQATIFTSVTSGMTLSNLTCATWGKMCMLSFVVKPSAAQTSAFVIGTLATDYRPVATCTANPYHSSVATARILTNGTIQMTAAPANEIPVSFTYLLA